MRVAICSWGICRSTDYTIESIEHNIFNPLRNADIEYDIYLHTYNLYKPYENVRSGEYNIQMKNTLWKLLKPIASCIENQEDIDNILQLEKYRIYGSPWKEDYKFQTLNNHVRALWSLKQVTDLWSNSGIQYDAIIYIRPDVRFMIPIKIEWLTTILPNSIVLPNFQMIGGVNDRFAIIKPGTAKVYGSRFNGALEYSKSHQLHSELYLSSVLKNRGIIINPVYFPFRRIRANGNIQDEDTKL